MSIKQLLLDRSESKCELCASTENLQVYAVPPSSSETLDDSVLLCETCISNVESPDAIDTNHWRCLNDSMWNPNAAVQVTAWRVLNDLRAEGWPLDLLDMLYLDEETLAWAKKTVTEQNPEDTAKHVDSNGAVLESGDTVVLIKDLNVKGANFTAKRGTPVRNISLVYDNVEHIEGRVNGQQIVILTKFVKK